MNVKLGNLVRYVGTNAGHIPGVYRWVGRAVKFCPADHTGGDAWLVEPRLHEGFSKDGYFYAGKVIEDVSLRPIDGGESPEESIEAMRLLTNIPSEVTA